jgi:hypothetical protein
MSKTGILIAIAAVIIAFSYLIWYGKKNQSDKQKLKENGIEVTGTVINRSIIRKPNQFETYNIKYDFNYNGKQYSGNTTFTKRWYYDNAIIGMKYKIRVLPSSPGKFSEILIEKPLKEEYVNIAKERERILSTYKDAEVFLKKNARPLEEIPLK